MVALVRVAYRVGEAVVFTGFSGTIVESLVVKILGPDLHNASLKPVSITPFFYNGRPVVGRAAIPPGGRLEFRVGVAYPSLAERFLKGVADVELFGRRLLLEEVEFREVFDGPMPDSRCFKVEFLTPVRFAVRPYMRRRRALFDFFPRPFTLFKSAVAHGRGLGLLRLGAPFLRWVYTYVALTDFGCGSCRCVNNVCRYRCVRTVGLPNGGVARGFVGWALYRAFGRRRLGDMWKVLRLMEVFNVGTGRGMGLGVVRVTPLDCGVS
ncbi:MAG: CRISPR-associated endoribonuclease Cas6 [Pyrobaculum sp.]